MPAVCFCPSKTTTMCENWCAISTVRSRLRASETMVSCGMRRLSLNCRIVFAIVFSSSRAGMMMESRISPINRCELLTDSAKHDKEHHRHRDSDGDLEVPRNVAKEIAEVIADAHEEQYPHDATDDVNSDIAYKRHAKHPRDGQDGHGEPESHREFRNDKYFSVVVVETPFDLLDHFWCHAEPVAPAREEWSRGVVPDEVPHRIGEH